MKSVRLNKVCALLAATLILPALAYAQDNQGGNNNSQGNFPHAPEANAGWVLVPFFGVVLFFSARRLFRGKAAE
jgi:hypothetical protein